MDINTKKLLKEYLTQAANEGRQAQGIRGLRSRVPKVFDYIDEKGIDIKFFGIREASGYQGWLINSGRIDGKRYNTRTILSYLSCASGFFDFLKQKGIVYSNPFKEIKYIRAGKTLPKEILKEKELGRLLSYFAGYWERPDLKSKTKAYRMHVLIELLYSTGLRITEAATLRVEDIDFDSGTIRVREGKGGYSRTVILNEYARDVLYLYVTRIRDLIQTRWHDPKLLFGTGWERFGKWANNALSEAVKDLSIPAVTCHGIRHALGFHLLRAGCPLRNIQSILGHKRIKNTEIYTKVDKDDLKKVIDRYHPRQWRISA